MTDIDPPARSVGPDWKKRAVSSLNRSLLPEELYRHIYAVGAYPKGLFGSVVEAFPLIEEEVALAQGRCASLQASGRLFRSLPHDIATALMCAQAGLPADCGLTCRAQKARRGRLYDQSIMEAAIRLYMGSDLAPDSYPFVRVVRVDETAAGEFGLFIDLGYGLEFLFAERDAVGRSFSSGDMHGATVDYNARAGTLRLTLYHGDNSSVLDIDLPTGEEGWNGEDRGYAQTATQSLRADVASQAARALANELIRANLVLTEVRYNGATLTTGIAPEGTQEEELGQVVALLSSIQGSAEIELGDGRLGLFELDGNYSVVIRDDFTGESIPVEPGSDVNVDGGVRESLHALIESAFDYETEDIVLYVSGTLRFPVA